MPLAIVNLGASANPDINLTTNINNYSGTSWTPPTTGLLIVDVHSAQTSGNPPIPIPGGNNLLFYNIQTVLGGASGGHRLTRFGANLTGSITGETGFVFTGSSQLCCRVSFYYASGTSVDLTQGVTGSFVQSPTASGNDTTGTITLSAAGNSNNRPIAAFIHLANEGKTPRTNWTELDDLAGSAPISANETQFRADAFETTASATWATLAQWAGIASEIKAAAVGNIYNDNVSISRLETVKDTPQSVLGASLAISEKGGISDRNFANMFARSAFSDALGLLDGLTNSIGKQVIINRLTGFNNAMGVGQFSVINLADVLGINLLKTVSIFPNISLGKKTGFVPANIALIGGSVSVAEALGLIDVPQLNAQARLTLQEKLANLFSSSLSGAALFEIVQTLSDKLGITSSAKLNINPLVGIGEKLFLTDGNIATLNTANSLTEKNIIGISGGLALFGNIAVPIKEIFLAQKLVSLFQGVSIQEKLGISDRAIANMNAGLGVAEKTGMIENVFQALNAGAGLNVLYSIVTGLDGTIIISIKGFVFASESAKNLVDVDVANLIKTINEARDFGKNTLEVGDE